MRCKRFVRGCSAVFIVKAALLLLSCAEPQQPKFQIDDLHYQGALRIPVQSYGDSRMGWANGTFAVAPDGHSFYAIGHSHHQMIAEFPLLDFKAATDLTELALAAPALQNFAPLLTEANSGNSQGLNTVTGMAFIGGKLIVNAAKYYDAAASNTDTTLVVSSLEDLTTLTANGYSRLEARMRGAGWMTPIPTDLQAMLGGDTLFGWASNIPINGRLSMGPSAFSVNSADLLAAGAGDTIPSKEMLGYSIQNQLHQDHYNTSLKNDIWTEVSRAVIGFIVPGTHTYAVFGTSGGHEHGIGYKITQKDSGHQCGGGCSYYASDNYNYYWFYDVADFKAVLDGNKQPHQVRPYQYGKLNLPFERTSDTQFSPNLLISAYFDKDRNHLYFMLGSADPLQSKFERAPLLLKYSIKLSGSEATHWKQASVDAPLSKHEKQYVPAANQ